MCPDKSLLSAYYDGEVDDPWKSKLKKHLEQCEECHSQIMEFEQASQFLNNNIKTYSSKRETILYERILQQHRRSKIIPYWERKTVWPIAVAALLVMGFSFLLGPRQGQQVYPQPTLVLLDEKEADLSAMNKLTPIMLPAEQKFSFYGESQIMKAVGFEEGGVH